ncbi:MAG: TIR domain-containing protein [Phycisphaerales bacterium]|nr:TIR domain-containing protein [Phycisphaerales bacterium]MCI0676327.1 TIR domain-containing protein [Phycisphaerales bacterium]
MAKPRVFISFDIADRDVKQNLVTQAADPKCPFTFVDNSIPQALPDKWVPEARRLIRDSDFVIVLCGDQTHQATGVETELQITKELKKPYALIKATRQYTPTRPRSASPTEPMYPATWPTVAALLRGEKPAVA